MYGTGDNSGPPTWFIFLIGIAVVFGLYYVWLGVRDFARTGGLGIREATEIAATIRTATAERIAEIQTRAPTLRPTATPLPPCQEFVVVVSSAIVREGPSTNSEILESLPRDTAVCVIARNGETEWYLVDRNRNTRRLEAAFMHEDIIDAVNPTPTPSDTPIPPPTVTLTPTFTPSDTPEPVPTRTPDPDASETPTPTYTPSPTPPSVSL